MIRGEYVLLRVPEMDDADIITAWENDSEVTKYLLSSYPVSKMAVERNIHELKQHKDKLVFIIGTEDNIPIGISSLTEIDWINGTAKIDVVIYAKSCWGRGYGYDALKTLTGFCLRHANLHTLYANILDGNDRAIRCFQKCGYAVEGTLHHRIFKEGKYLNIVSMSICKDGKIEE